MSAPKEVIRLVETFRNNIQSLKSDNYNETQVRREYIDPLFEALGWDVFNENSYAEAYKDVIHEYSQKTTDTTKNPDYCFRIGGKRKFFVEAKKPSINLKDNIHPAYQLRRYGWSAKLPLSILTDFEEFAVYDCRILPKKNDKASTARIMFLTFDDYLEKWDELVDIFSKDAILKGSFDKYAESNKKKRGTADVDEAFLNEMEGWRNLLARNIALRNLSLSIRELNFSVQKTIDRIIFLRICEDRGIENYGQLLNLMNGTNVYERLKQIFTRADEKYNSGLFHFEKEKDRNDIPDEITPSLQIDDKTLKDIIKNLYYPESPYEFSVLPADILGHVYEQFLGKVIRLTPAHFAVVEDKPEVKKAGGVYYTPTYIVEYIVKNTVGKILENKTPREVSKIRILDPACGSGSFLLGAYQYLLDWHLKYYTENVERISDSLKKRKPPIYQIQEKEYRLTTTERKRILLNNIYGVDIDSQAVEVTKLSLLLKVLEGESEETLTNQMKMFHQRALPDLGNNIKCGNSLIGPDFYDQLEMNLLEDEEKIKINVFDWESEFKDIMNNGGFDVVIGNPPYGAELTNNEKDYLSGKFQSYEYQINSFVTFIEQGCVLTNKKGLLSYIVPAVILSQHFYKKIRKFIIDSYHINNLLLLNYKVFLKADTGDTTILILENPLKYNIEENQINFSTLTSSIEIKNINYSFLKQNETLSNDRFEINTSQTDNILKKVYSQSLMLKKLAKCITGIKPYQKGKGRPKQNAIIVKERPFDSDVKINKYYKQYLMGKDINKYLINPLKERFIKYGEWLAEPRRTAPFEKTKIIVRQTSDIIRASLDENKYYNLNNIYNIEIVDDDYNYYYVLALLNCKLMEYIYHKVVPEKNRVFAEIKKVNLDKIPIKILKNKNDIRISQDLINLSKSMIKLNKNFLALSTPTDKTALQRQIDATDKNIDKLVYELYGLTEDEIKVVEGSK